MSGPPDWMTHEYVTRVFKEGLNEPNLKVLSFDVEPAVGKGENYSSILLRVTVRYVISEGSEPQDRSFIFKTQAVGEFLKFSVNTRLFKKEALMTRSILPEVNKLLKKYFPDQKNLNATAIWNGLTPVECIVFEDLKVSGFQLLDRFAGMDLETCQFVLKNLARMHAASLRVLEEHSVWRDELLEYNYWMDKEYSVTYPLLATGLKAFAAEAEAWEEFPKEWLERVKVLMEGDSFKFQVECQKYRETSLNVLCHGDCWNNNIMFKQEADKITELRFVDLAQGMVNSWAIDLNYFLALCPKKEIRRTQFNHLLKYYHGQFMENIEIMGISLPKQYSFEDFQEEMKSRAFHGFLSFVCFYPIMILDSSTLDATPEQISFEHETKRKVWRNPLFREIVNEFFIHYIEAEVL